MGKLKITIEGSARTGKTTVAFLIKTLLHKRSDVVVRIHDVDWDSHNISDNAYRYDYAEEFLQDLEEVDIHIVQTRRKDEQL